MTHDRRYSARRNRDTKQHIGGLHGPSLVGHHEHLARASHPAQQFDQTSQIALVERGVGFVEHEKRYGSNLQHGEQQREPHERALAARQQRQPTHALGWQIDIDTNRRRQRIGTSLELDRTASAREELPNDAPKRRPDLLDRGQHAAAHLLLEPLESLTDDSPHPTGLRKHRAELLSSSVELAQLDTRETVHLAEGPQGIFDLVQRPLNVVRCDIRGQAGTFDVSELDVEAKAPHLLLGGEPGSSSLGAPHRLEQSLTRRHERCLGRPTLHPQPLGLGTVPRLPSKQQLQLLVKTAQREGNCVRQSVGTLHELTWYWRRTNPGLVKARTFALELIEALPSRQRPLLLSSRIQSHADELLIKRLPSPLCGLASFDGHRQSVGRRRLSRLKFGGATSDILVDVLDVDSRELCREARDDRRAIAIDPRLLGPDPLEIPAPRFTTVELLDMRAATSLDNGSRLPKRRINGRELLADALELRGDRHRLILELTPS